jgi:hypothetical protein
LETSKREHEFRRSVGCVEPTGPAQSGRPDDRLRGICQCSTFCSACFMAKRSRPRGASRRPTFIVGAKTRVKREELRGRHAASLLPGGEKDRMRGFGLRSLILNLPNPLTPTLSPPGRGSCLRRHRRTFMASAPVLAAPLSARAFLRAIRRRSRAGKMPSREARNRFGEKESQGWGLSFGLPLRQLRPIKTSRHK